MSLLSRAISECFRDEVDDEVLYKSTLFTFYLLLYIRNLVRPVIISVETQHLRDQINANFGAVCKPNLCLSGLTTSPL